MIGKLFGALFKSHNDRQVKKYEARVPKILAFGEKLTQLSDEELQAKTTEFKSRIEAGESLDNLMPEAYAVVKDACRRLCGTTHLVMGKELEWNMVPYDVQLVGAMVLHDCGISEMATGEGKTLVATMPLYLNALSGKNCQLVTVNDYLAARDSQWMGVVLKFLGLTVGCIAGQMPPEIKRAQYRCDVTYGTNSEFGFDYLRDMGASSKEDMVQNGHYFSIIDEIDSILIDEARTPLIIAGPVPVSTHKYDELKSSIDRLYSKQNQLCLQLVSAARKVLNDDNSDKESVEQAYVDLFKVKLGMPKLAQLMTMMEEPKHRKGLEKKEGEVRSTSNKGWLERVKETLLFSVDEQANDVGLSEKGRIFLSPDDSDSFMLPDLSTQFSEIDGFDISEAEQLEKKQTLQSDFEKRAEIIHNISQLLKAYTLFEVDTHYVVVDNKVMIVDEHTGRIMDGRRFSDGLHQALEAKESVKIERETQSLASITIQNYFRMYDKLAGMTGTAETEATEFKDIYSLNVVTIPTNRPCIRIDAQDRIYKTKREKYNAIVKEVQTLHATGQPILLGTISVEVSEVLSKLLNKAKIPHNVLNAKQHKSEAEIVERAGQLGAITIATNMAGRGTDIKLGEGVTAIGGLHVIASERHDSRRIDRQLRGRCSRQGDPGSSVFYISLEDDLMRLFGSDRVSMIMDRLGMVEGEELQSSILSRAIGGAQKKVENQHYSVRRQILQYDDVMNKQREVIYGFRQEVIQADEMRELLFDVVERAVDDSFDKFVPENPTAGPIDKTAYCNWLQGLFPITIPSDLLGCEKKFDREKALEDVVNLIDEAYTLKEASEDPEALRWLESEIILNAIDKLYKEHLYEMDQLRNSIHLRSHAQKDPLVEYKREAFILFQELMNKVSTEILTNMFRSSTSIEAMRKFLMDINMQEIHEAAEQFDGKHNEEPEVAPEVAGVSMAPGEPLRPLTRSYPKVGRNDPCPCGSGKKFKQCCDKN